MKLYYTSQMFIIIITISCQIIIFHNCLDAPCIFTELLKMIERQSGSGLGRIPQIRG